MLQAKGLFLDDTDIDGDIDDDIDGDSYDNHYWDFDNPRVMFQGV
jgi:hypothetical protein